MHDNTVYTLLVWRIFQIPKSSDTLEFSRSPAQQMLARATNSCNLLAPSTQMCCMEQGCTKAGSPYLRHFIQIWSWSYLLPGVLIWTAGHFLEPVTAIAKSCDSRNNLKLPTKLVQRLGCTPFWQQVFGIIKYFHIFLRQPGHCPLGPNSSIQEMIPYISSIYSKIARACMSSVWKQSSPTVTVAFQSQAYNNFTINLRNISWFFWDLFSHITFSTGRMFSQPPPGPFYTWSWKAQEAQSELVECTLTTSPLEDFSLPYQSIFFLQYSTVTLTIVRSCDTVQEKKKNN